MGLEIPRFKGEEKRVLARSVVSNLTGELKNIDTSAPGAFTELEKRLAELAPRVEHLVHTILGNTIPSEAFSNVATPEEAQEFANLLDQKARQYNLIADNLRQL